MRAALLFLLLPLGLFSTGCESCRREPAIVIRFEPIDASAQRVDLQKPSAAADLASVAAAAPAAAPAAKASACTKDSECVLEMEGCCPCTATGKQRAVHKKDRESEAALSKRCGGTMCGQAISSDPSCGKKAACIKGVCALK